MALELKGIAAIGNAGLLNHVLHIDLEPLGLLSKEQMTTDAARQASGPK
jgi:hypothetical protein